MSATLAEALDAWTTELAEQIVKKQAKDGLSEKLRDSCAMVDAAVARERERCARIARSAGAPSIAEAIQDGAGK